VLHLNSFDLLMSLNLKGSKLTQPGLKKLAPWTLKSVTDQRSSLIAPERYQYAD
jgi:hypothetical protein